MTDCCIAVTLMSCLFFQIECTGPAPEVYANIAGIIKVLAELFSGQVSEVNLEGREATAANSNDSFSGHRDSYHQQQTSEQRDSYQHPQQQPTSEHYSPNTTSSFTRELLLLFGLVNELRMICD